LPEVRVSLGGEPERDDTGLPPVDIEIPDDARELDRDVQAYHRELRARRRELRHRRLTGPLARDGIVLPLLAGCLVLALIAGTLLTVFTAAGLNNEVQPGGGAQSTRPSAPVKANSTPTAPVTVPQLQALSGVLPHATVIVDDQQVPLYRLIANGGAVLVLVPAGNCNCSNALGQLNAEAVAANVPIYLVSSRAGLARAKSLATSTGPPVKVAEDNKMVLAKRYQPSGLTALLVSTDGSVAEASQLKPGLKLTGALQHLASAGAAG
jgi:hypothetical protein